MLLEGDELDLRLGWTVGAQLRRDRLDAEVVSSRQPMLTVHWEIEPYRSPTTALSCVAENNVCAPNEKTLSVRKP
jgi:hypothetical protein